MYLPLWQNMSADALSRRLEAALRTNGIEATRVVERRVAQGTNPFVLSITVFAAPALMLTTISNDERVSWIIWTWLIAIAVWLTRRRSRANRAPTQVA
jgi:hypothetical protein